MEDREKVIKGLQNLRDAIATDYIRETDQAVGTIDDAIELLKEQEAVEPIIMDHIVFGTSRKCSKCNRYLFPAGGYCPHCGRKVNWDA